MVMFDLQTKYLPSFNWKLQFTRRRMFFILNFQIFKVSCVPFDCDSVKYHGIYADLFGKQYHTWVFCFYDRLWNVHEEFHWLGHSDRSHMIDFFEFATNEIHTKWIDCILLIKAYQIIRNSTRFRFINTKSKLKAIKWQKNNLLLMSSLLYLWQCQDDRK